MENLTAEKVTPFLKWPGGKRWLVKDFSNHLEKDYLRYVEPFAGSGAVFFHVYPEKALISDVNKQLVETYCSIRDEWQLIVKELGKHHRKHNKEYYYEIRKRTFSKRHQRAAQLIYLNRTCFNGIYRVNLKGEFNVPIGTKTNVLLDSDNFEEISRRMQGVDIRCSDFESTINECGEGDFVFVDPPYTVKHNFNGFVKYNEKIFSWADQVRLKNTIVKAVDRGAKFLISNADHESIRDLYEGVGEIECVNRNSVIAASSENRGKTTEVLINIR